MVGESQTLRVWDATGAAGTLNNTVTNVVSLTGSEFGIVCFDSDGDMHTSGHFLYNGSVVTSLETPFTDTGTTPHHHANEIQQDVLLVARPSTSATVATSGILVYRDVEAINYMNTRRITNFTGIFIDAAYHPGNDRLPSTF